MRAAVSPQSARSTYWLSPTRVVVPRWIKVAELISQHACNQWNSFGGPGAFTDSEVREAIQMTSKLFGIFGKSALPALVAGAILAFGSPAAALAAGHGGGRSGGGFAAGGRGFSAGAGARGFNGAGRFRGGEREAVGGVRGGG